MNSDHIESPTIATPTPDDQERERLLKQHEQLLIQVQSDLYELQERRNDLRNIIAALKRSISPI